MERKHFEHIVANAEGAVPGGQKIGGGLFELMQACRIRCHGGGTEHAASICLDCPHFISCRPNQERNRVTVACWWHEETAKRTKERRLARGTGITVAPPLLCETCGVGDDSVQFHPHRDNEAICAACLGLELCTEIADQSELAWAPYPPAEELGY